MRTLLALCVAVLASVARADRTEFAGVFAPTSPLVADAERPHRDAICLNGKWQFQPVEVPRDWQPDRGQPPELTPPRNDAWDATPIKIPSHWNVNTWGNGRNVGAGTPFPFRPDSVYFPSYPASWDGVRMAWMRRSVTVPESWRDCRVLLRFEAVAGECRVLVNGKRIGEPHFDSYLPFEIDVTDALQLGRSNEILVGVRSPHLFDQRSERYPKMIAPYPCGSNTDGLAGIWQDVHLLAVPAVRVEDVFPRPSVDERVIQFDVVLRNDSTVDHQVLVSIDIAGVAADGDSLQRPDARPATRPAKSLMNWSVKPLPIRAGQRVTYTLTQPAGPNLRTWSPSSPTLYFATVKITDWPTGAELDAKQRRFGYRDFTIKGPDLLLNGQPIKVVGDLTHPFGPWIQSRRFAWAWFQMVKEMGGNAVRLHGQPFPKEYLDLADEMGILVLDETALFGSSVRLNFDSEVAWNRFESHVDGLVLRDRHHPCVMGWSIGNELFAIFEQNEVSKEQADRWYAKLARLEDRVRAHDPGRFWVSCDGDEDLRGALPVWSKHFGHGVPLDRLPTGLYKPLMVGESGGTYYATPKQLSVFNGDRAYDSYAGRNEALAIDVYDNVTQMARPRLAYFSPSEMVWFGLEHLNLGYSDFSRLPGKDDGIFFTAPYVDGQPGMQIERIPPYVTTLNPGLDRSLPTYKPLAMFHAFQAAMHQPEPLPNPTSRPAAATQPAPLPAATIDRVAYVGGEPLKRKLRLLGVPVDVAGGPAARFLITDGSSDTKTEVDACLRQGGTVFECFGDDAEATDLTLADRPATALTRVRDSGITAVFNVPELYFAEDAADRFVLKRALAGPRVEQGRVLLEASGVDWSLFNNQPEAAKCGAVVLYEHLKHPRGVALVELADGRGGYHLLSSIDMNLASSARYAFWRKLFSAMGVKLVAPPSRWLSPIAIADSAGVDWRYTFEPQSGDTWTQVAYDDAAWSTGKGGIGERVPNAMPRTAWRGNDVWMRRTVTLSEKDLTDVAADGVKLVAHYDENVEVYLNGQQVLKREGFTTRYQAFDLPDAAKRSLRVGPNVLAAHCSQVAGGKYIDVGLATGIVSEAQLTVDAADHDLLLNGPKE